MDWWQWIIGGAIVVAVLILSVLLLLALNRLGPQPSPPHADLAASADCGGFLWPRA